MKETNQKRPDIPLTRKAITVELWEIYEEIVEGLAKMASIVGWIDARAKLKSESTVYQNAIADLDSGRIQIAGATERIGKLLGLDKITKED